MSVPRGVERFSQVAGGAVILLVNAFLFFVSGYGNSMIPINISGLGRRFRVRFQGKRLCKQGGWCWWHSDYEPYGDRIFLKKK